MEYNRVHFPSGKSYAMYKSSSHFGEKRKGEKWHGEGRQSQVTLDKAAMTTTMILSRRIFVITVIIVHL